VCLGLNAYKGHGAQQSSNEAARSTLKAAELGHAHSQYVVSVFYRTGNGIIKSFPDSIKWLSSAAMAGHEGAQIALAQHYRTGDIVAQDLVQSYAWFNIADSRGAANASVNREIVAGLLSGEQLNQAQTLSSQIYQKVSREAPPEPVIQGGSLRNILASSVDPLAGLPQYVPPSVAGAAGNTNLVSFSPLMGRNFTIPGLELEMIWIPAGKFMMGSPASEPNRMDRETHHEVTLTKGFLVGEI